ncbi:MAG: FecR domain-containing protein [bacterium]|nr:FecR domain-containing protein [bacterium]
MKRMIRIVLAVIFSYSSLAMAQEVEVKEGDSLYKIVKQYLGDERLWEEIAEYNRLKNPSLIYPGDIIKIPYYISKMRLTSIFGDVKVKKEKAKGFIKVEEETSLDIFDKVETSSESRAVLEFEDGSLVRLKPKTQLQIKKALIGREKKGLISKLRMNLGKIFLELKTRKEETKFEVETPASICGARGTEFRTSHTKEGISRVEVFEGSIEAEAEGKSLEVPSGYGSSIVTNHPPSAPRLLPESPGLISPGDNITTPNQRPTLEWAKAPVAKSYHVELARDSDFNDVVQELKLEETTLTTVGLPEGQYYWHVSSIDETKLEGAFSQARSMNIIKEMEVLLQPNQPPRKIEGLSFVSESWGFAIDLPEETSAARIEVNVDGAGFEEYEPPYSFKKEGVHQIEYRAVDVFGKPGPVQKTEVFVDAAPPEMWIICERMIEIESKYFAPLEAKFNLSAGDKLTGVNKILVKVDQGDFKEYQEPFLMETPGLHTIGYKAVDGVGNWSDEEGFQVITDAAPPEIWINCERMIEHESKYFAPLEAMFSLSARDRLTGVNKILIKVDQGDFREYQEPFLMDTSGVHTISYKAIDGVGNCSDEKELQVITDAAPPEIWINCERMIEHESKYFAPLEAMFSLSARDRLTGVNKILIKVDQGDFREYQEPFLMDTPGVHTISCKAIDGVGNCSDEKELQVITDAAPPEIWINCERMIEHESKYFAPLEAMFSLSAGDKLTGVNKIWVKVDQGDFKEYQEPFLMDTPGSHTISYKAIDGVGNCSDEEKFYVITDVNPPEIEINCDRMVRYKSKYAAPLEAMFTISARDRLTDVNKILVKVDQGAFKEYQEPFLMDTPGSHTIRCKTIDKAGNWSDEEELQVIIDTTSPEIDISCNAGMIRYNKSTYFVPLRSEACRFRITAADKESGRDKILVKVNDDKEFKEHKEPLVITKGGGHIIKCKASDRAGNWTSEKRFKIMMGLTRSEYSTVGLFLLYMGFIINSAK